IQSPPPAMDADTPDDIRLRDRLSVPIKFVPRFNRANIQAIPVQKPLRQCDMCGKLSTQCIQSPADKDQAMGFFENLYNLTPEQRKTANFYKSGNHQALVCNNHYKVVTVPKHPSYKINKPNVIKVYPRLSMLPVNQRPGPSIITAKPKQLTLSNAAALVNKREMYRLRGNGEIIMGSARPIDTPELVVNTSNKRKQILVVN
ncbi:hypothetical protein PFISCL1PPCAC_26543, partial [Pristionchus fissidentatus]